MSEAETPSRKSANRIGDHVKRGFSNYLDHWQEWIKPTLVAAAIAVASVFCCCVPSFFLLGPIYCGLYCCALTALRGRPVELADFKRGWRKVGSSIVAGLFINLGSALPAIVLYGLVIGVLSIVASLVPTEMSTVDASGNGESQAITDESDAQIDKADGDDAETVAELEGKGQAEGEETPERQEFQDADGQPRQQMEEPSATALLMVFVCVIIFYGTLFLAILLAWVWTLWFSTRTMFILPLIADRQCGFTAALRESWRETRTRFWELLLINFLAGIIGAIGVYMMYVGMLFTMPIAFAIIASVYDERFPKGEKPEST